MKAFIILFILLFSSVVLAQEVTKEQLELRRQQLSRVIYSIAGKIEYNNRLLIEFGRNAAELDDQLDRNRLELERVNKELAQE